MQQQRVPAGMSNGVPVAVSPIATTIVPSSPTTRAQFLAVTLLNSDASQTLAAWLEASPDGTNWSDPIGIGLDAVGPLKSAVARVEVGGYQNVRVRGTASGAGLNCKPWAYLLEVVR